MSIHHNVFSVFLLSLVFAVGLAGCTSTPHPEGKPLPQLTFQHLESVPLPVNEVEVVNNYDPGDNENDVSEVFPTPPDIAIRRYAENRLGAEGHGSGVFGFTVENASVTYKELAPESQVMNWLDLGRKEQFIAHIRLKLSEMRPGGGEDGIRMKFTKSLTIDSSASLAKRDRLKLEFLEALIADIDQTLIDFLHEQYAIERDRYLVYGVSGPGSSAPEAGQKDDK